MYKSFFGFRAKPFNDNPELRFHYVTPAYAENFNAIRKSIRQNLGLNTLTGESGTGKTLFLERLISASRNQDIYYVRSDLANPTLEQLVDLLCDQLDLLAIGKSHDEKLQWVKASLVENAKQGRLFVLAIDDAHKLADSTLRDLLIFYRDQDPVVLQIVLLGQPELEGKVHSAAASVGLDSGTICQLEPLTDADIPSYIEQQLRAAGYQGTGIFEPEAIERIARFAGNSLRELSLICDAALVIAHLQSSHTVTAEFVNEAAQQHKIEKHQHSDHHEPTHSDAEDDDAEAFLRRLAEEQKTGRRTPSGAPGVIGLDTATSPALDKNEENLFATDLPAGKASDSALASHIPLVAGLAIGICTVIIGGVYFLQSPDDLASSGTEPTGFETSIDAGEIKLVQPTEPSQSPPTDAGSTAATGSTPVATVSADSSAGKPIATTVDPVSTPTTTNPPTGAQLATATPVAPATGDSQASAILMQPVATSPSSSETKPYGIDVPKFEAIENPQIRILLQLAGAQIRAGQIISPEQDNALETFIEILKIAPDNRAALVGLTQINEYFFDQVATAQQTRELFFEQAAAARQEQQKYLDQFALAKKDKEAYLRDINAFYVGQAILANRYKVDSLIEAETAQQSTQQYLENLTGQLQPQRRPAREQNKIVPVKSQAMLTPQQTLLAESRIDRLLHRAKQQIAERRIAKPARNSALSTYRQVLDIEPENSSALAGLEFIMNQFLDWAALSVAQNNLNRAQYYFDQAMEVDPQNVNLAQKVRTVRQQVMVAESAIGKSKKPNSSSTPHNLNSSPQLSEALLQSARLGDSNSVTTLLSSGAAVDVPDLRGNTALIIAADLGHSEVIATLLKRGAKPNRTNAYGQTALMRAAAAGKTHTVQMLLANGASPHARDADGRTALIDAATSGQTDIATLLLDNGADLNVRSKSGRTALMAAAWKGHSRVIRLFLSRNAEIDTKNNDGWTALGHAAWQGHADVAQLLLTNGANRDILNNNGMTPSSMASNRGHNDVARLLQ